MQLRPMTFDDADFLLEMKNDPETRKFAIISKEEIKREDHLEWLKDNIQYFQMIQYFGNNLTVGAIRIMDNEVSIWINTTWRGAGIGTSVLEKYTQKGMTAKIVEGNIPSMRAFINAGFKPVKYKSNYYIFQK